jgi:hypothetical protein
MYANISNPPGTAIQMAVPRLDPDRHISRVSRLSRLLALLARAREKIAYSSRQFDMYSPQSSPFVPRERWEEDIRRWSYITWRLERYYLKKVCELNSETYKAVAE